MSRVLRLALGLSLALAGRSFAAPAAPSRILLAPSTVTFSATGDIRLDGPIADLAARNGASAPSKEVRDLLAADIVFGNLETTLSTRGAKLSKTWNIRAKPGQLRIVKAAGYTVLNLANNHVWDYGERGFLDTLRAVKKAGFQLIGAGKTLADAEKLLIIHKNGLKIGLLGMTSTFPKEAWARHDKPGVLYSDDARVKEWTAQAKAKCDLLIVSFHGGTELAELPNDIQKAVAHSAIDGGADLFLGHHPHVLQPIELYKGKPIFYSLGNFFFVSPTPATRASVIVRAVLDAAGVHRLELLPIDINGGQPKPANLELASQARAALDRLGALEARPDLLAFQTP